MNTHVKKEENSRKPPQTTTTRGFEQRRKTLIILDAAVSSRSLPVASSSSSASSASSLSLSPPLAALSPSSLSSSSSSSSSSYSSSSSSSSSSYSSSSSSDDLPPALEHVSVDPTTKTVQAVMVSRSLHVCSLLPLDDTVAHLPVCSCNRDHKQSCHGRPISLPRTLNWNSMFQLGRECVDNRCELRVSFLVRPPLVGGLPLLG